MCISETAFILCAAATAARAAWSLATAKEICIPAGHVGIQIEDDQISPSLLAPGKHRVNEDVLIVALKNTRPVGKGDTELHARARVSYRLDAQQLVAWTNLQLREPREDFLRAMAESQVDALATAVLRFRLALLATSSEAFSDSEREEAGLQAYDTAMCDQDRRAFMDTVASHIQRRLDQEHRGIFSQVELTMPPRCLVFN